MWLCVLVLVLVCATSRKRFPAKRLIRPRSASSNHQHVVRTLSAHWFKCGVQCGGNQLFSLGDV